MWDKSRDPPSNNGVPVLYSHTTLIRNPHIFIRESYGKKLTIKGESPIIGVPVPGITQKSSQVWLGVKRLTFWGGLKSLKIAMNACLWWREQGNREAAIVSQSSLDFNYSRRGLSKISIHIHPLGGSCSPGFFLSTQWRARAHPKCTKHEIRKFYWSQSWFLRHDEWMQHCVASFEWPTNIARMVRNPSFGFIKNFLLSKKLPF